MLCGGSAAAETPFAAFERRCLTPLSEFRLPIVADAPVWADANGTWTTTPTTCRLETTGSALAEAEAWATATRMAGRFEADGDALLSTLWREPRLRVRLSARGASAIFLVEQTALES